MTGIKIRHIKIHIAVIRGRLPSLPAKITAISLTVLNQEIRKQVFIGRERVCFLFQKKTTTTKIKRLGVWGVGGGELLTQSMNFFNRNIIFMKLNQEGVFLPKK